MSETCSQMSSAVQIYKELIHNWLNTYSLQFVKVSCHKMSICKFPIAEDPVLQHINTLCKLPERATPWRVGHVIRCTQIHLWHHRLVSIWPHLQSRTSNKCLQRTQIGSTQNDHSNLANKNNYTILSPLNAIRSVYYLILEEFEIAFDLKHSNM